MPVYITHVGSFPLEYGKGVVERVAGDLAEAGVDWPGFPQLRDFVETYLEPLINAGLVVRRKGFFTLSDRELVESYDLSSERIVPEAKEFINAVKRLHLKFKGMKASVTGPFTLASRIMESGAVHGFTSSVLRDREFVLDWMVSYVRGFVRGLYGLGYGFIVVDEPILSLMVGRKILYGFSPEDVASAITNVFKGVGDGLSGIHVCGRVSPLLAEILLNSGIRVLDHEHKDSPENLQLYDADTLASYNKFLALGVVSSKNLKVEQVDEIASLVKDGLDRYGDRLLFVKPDCGFRGLKLAADSGKAYEIAIAKLKNIVKAVRRLNV